MKRMLAIVAAVVGVAVAVLAIVVVWGNSTSGAMTEPIRAQLQALKTGDVAGAAKQLAPGGLDETAFRALLAEHPALAHPAGFRVRDDRYEDETGSAIVELTSTAASPERLKFDLVKRDGSWLIQGIAPAPAAALPPTEKVSTAAAGSEAAAKIVGLSVSDGATKPPRVEKDGLPILDAFFREYFVKVDLDRSPVDKVPLKWRHRVQAQNSKVPGLYEGDYTESGRFSPKPGTNQIILTFRKARSDDDDSIDFNAGLHILSVQLGDSQQEVRFYVR